MHRGKAVQPDKGCEWCNKPLPTIRHPKTKFCDTICRGRDRWARENVGEGIKCLICGKTFNRVGSHVVQVHGYSSTLEYTREFGLMSRETHTERHAKAMRSKVAEKSIKNLSSGASTRFVEGGDHGERLKEFWSNRKLKKGV